MKTPIYLVPVDFTPVSDKAVLTALDLAKYNNGSVLAIHIVSKKAEREEAKNKFKAKLEVLTSEQRELIETKVLVGDLFSDIGKASELLSASLIVMGTHGARGMQKLFGSNALKLVSSTGTPFLILQKDGVLNDIKTIVLPFNFEKESIQIANFAGHIAKQFNATIHLVGYHDKDEWLKGKSNTNQQIVRSLLESNGIAYEIVNVNDNSKTYINALLDYTNTVKADIIATSFYIDTMLPTMNSFVQELIENDSQIPLLTVNAEELSHSSNLSFMSV